MKLYNFAKEHVAITRKGVEVIFRTQKSVLYNDGEPWTKKEGGSFDVTMGAYDGAEVCELIGIYILYLIGKKYNSRNIGLYSDDGLAALKNVSGPASEKIKEQLQSLFKQKGLLIIIECNLEVANYLDVTFNLNGGSYRPYRNTLYSCPVKSSISYNKVNSTVHRKALITIIIIKRYIF